MPETKLDPKEEQKYERLRKLAKELHTPTLEHFLTLEVFDKDGNLIQRHRQRSHSWTRNAYNVMFCQMAGKDGDDAGLFEAGKLSYKQTNGAIYAGSMPCGIVCGNVSDCRLAPNDFDCIGPSATTRRGGYRASGGIDTCGILVGSGTNAESFEDYFLQTQIDEGTGAGQLSHILSEEHAISYADTTLTNTLIRYFNNNSGGNVNVNEVGLIAICGSEATSSLAVMMSRDKLGATVTVPDTGQLKVTYTISLTYPE